MPTGKKRQKRCVVCSKPVPLYGCCPDCRALMQRINALHRPPRRAVERTPKVYRAIV